MRMGRSRCAAFTIGRKSPVVPASVRTISAPQQCSAKSWCCAAKVVCLRHDCRRKRRDTAASSKRLRQRRGHIARPFRPMRMITSRCGARRVPLAGVIYPIAALYDAPLMLTRVLIIRDFCFGNGTSLCLLPRRLRARRSRCCQYARRKVGALLEEQAFYGPLQTNRHHRGLDRRL